MINENTILSSFDDKETLLKWLKKTEKALAESILQSITPIETSDGYFNLKFNFKDGTSIETPTAIQLKGYKGDKGDTGPRGEKGDPLAVGIIPSGTNLLEFDFTPYGSGSLFIGNNLKGMPTEIDPDHSQVVIQLIRNNSTLYCLKVFNTGLYQGNQGEYTIYHYATSYDGWKKVATTKEVEEIAYKQEIFDIINWAPNNNLTLDMKYCKIVKTNNILYCIFAFRLSNPTEKNIFINTLMGTKNYLPSSIANKLVCVDEFDNITFFKEADAYRLDSGGSPEYKTFHYILQKYDGSKITLKISDWLNAKTSYNFDIRIPLILV